MGRSNKENVDYFPHFVGGNRKTIFLLEDSWGNDGYAFWFKLLEILADNNGHFYDLSTFANLKYLCAYTRVNEQTAYEILDLLSDLGKIDSDLWRERKIVWCQGLVDNVKDVYKKRTTPIPVKPFSDVFSERQSSENDEKEEDIPLIPANTEKTEQKDETVKQCIDYEEVITQFKEICTDLPQPKTLSNKRKNAIKNCKSLLDEQGITFEVFFKKVAASDFLCRMSSGSSWKADIDFILRPEQVIKIIEGAHDNRRVPAKKGSGEISRQPTYDIEQIIADARNNVSIKGL